MKIKSIEQDFIEKVSEKIRVIPDGRDRYRVFTPFRFDDGDHIAIVLKKEQDRWLLSDGGHTYMHLTYDIDERKLFSFYAHARELFQMLCLHLKLKIAFWRINFEVKMIALAMHYILLPKPLIKMGDVLCLSKEYVQPTFMTDFQLLLKGIIPENRREFDWHDEKYDSGKKYIVDCRINGLPEPIFVYALSNNDRIRDATIKIQKVTQWDIPFRPLGIFQDREAANQQVVGRFDDVCEDQFPKMEANRNKIIDYISERI